MVNNTQTAQKRANNRRFELEKNSVGANYIVVDINNWTVKDIGFGSRTWIGCKVKTCGRNRIAVQHGGTWQEISADIKRG